MLGVEFLLVEVRLHRQEREEARMIHYNVLQLVMSVFTNLG